MKRVIKDPTYSIFSKGGNVVNKNKEIDKKQLADLEAGLKVDKQKTMMLVGMILVLLFLQAGSFVFM